MPKAWKIQVEYISSGIKFKRLKITNNTMYSHVIYHDELQ